jgi:hypothetical protein
MTEQDRAHEQQSEQSTEEREVTIKDIDVPEEDGKDVKGGGDFGNPKEF